MPPPGGWQDQFSSAPTMTPSPPPAQYPPPPPGWYSGVPPPQRRRRAWPIVLAIVVPLLVLVVGGIGFLRGEDPEAAADRDAAEAALLTNSDLGGTFSEVDHRTFARSRGGLRVDGGLSECTPADNALENDGQAVVDTVLQAQNGLALQVIAEEIIAMGSPESATPVVDAIASTARSCLSAAVQKSAPDVVISISPAAAPAIGDRALAFHGSMGVPGGQIAGDVSVLIVQQGRAVVLVLAVDTTGTLQGERMAELANKSLIRLVPHFGS